MDIFKIPLLLAISFFGLLAANWGVDPAYRFHGLVIALVAFSVFIMALRRAGEPLRQASEAGAYCDDVIRAVLRMQFRFVEVMNLFQVSIV